VTYLADIYSMGMVLWQMLAGELPFSAKSEAVIFSQKQKGPDHNLTEIIPDLPPEVAEIIYRMLESDPLKRISSYAEIRSALQREVRKFDDVDQLFPKKVVLKPIKPTFTTALDPELAKQQAAAPVVSAKSVIIPVSPAARPVVTPAEAARLATAGKPIVTSQVPRAMPAARPAATPAEAARLATAGKPIVTSQVPRAIPAARPVVPTQEVKPPLVAKSAAIPKASPSAVTTPAADRRSMQTVPKAIPLEPGGKKFERLKTTPNEILATATLKRVSPPAKAPKAIAIPAGAPVTPAKPSVPKAIQVAGPEAAFGHDLLQGEPKPPTGQIEKIKLTGRKIPVDDVPKQVLPSPYLTLIRMPSCRALDRELFAGKEIGNYRLIEKLGMGSLGVVMRAEDKEANREVAFKALVCDPDSMKDTAWDIHESEKRLAKLQHQGIAAPRRCSSIDGFSAMICELYLGVDGRALDLNGALNAYGGADGSLNQYEVRSLLLIVLDALGHAHSQETFHGNLKPENIIFPSTNGTRRKWYSELKITDFGLTTIVGTEFYLKLVRKSKRYFNRPKKMMGDVSALLRSYDFMSPEQRRGAIPTAQSDIYQIGLLLNYMLTGRLELCMGHRPSDFNSTMDPDWDHIIIRALREEPSKRFKSVEELAAEIANLPF
jgi:serine/threonine protein kinase